MKKIEVSMQEIYEAMRGNVQDIIIIVIGLILTPFTLLLVGITELINLIKTKHKDGRFKK